MAGSTYGLSALRYDIPTLEVVEHLPVWLRSPRVLPVGDAGAAGAV
ncbi:MAG TPA: hypothetical protein VEP50_09920 [bacterium]|nr:hypothetical protein [bacterium]